MHNTIRVLSLLIGILLSTQATSDDLCSKLLGHWQGTYTIKDPKICELYDGCTHKITAEVINPPTDLFVAYEVLVNPSMGVGGVFEITCNQDVIYSRVFPGNTITLSCDRTNECTMVYEDPNLLAHMTK